MILGAALGESYGTHPGAWRLPEVDPLAYTNVDVQVVAAQRAERGGLDYVFYPDRVFLKADLKSGPPMFSMDPLMVLAAVATATSKIGLVASGSTTFTEPYTLARQFRVLDVMSHGRAGWNAIPSYEPEAFANYGREMFPREEKYDRLNEVVQITQALWGSWGREAGKPDQASGIWADPAFIRPVNLQGRHAGSRGPLQVPPSEQGQPVIFMPVASGLGLRAAAFYSNGMIAMPSTIEEGRRQRALIRSLAEQAGRDPDEMKYLPFVSFGLGATPEAAVARRRTMEESADVPSRVRQLSAVLGIRIDETQADLPLTAEQIAAIRPHPGAHRARNAAVLAGEGLSPLDLLSHGMLEGNPGVVGTGAQAADLLEEWVDAGAADGFSVVPDALHDGLDQFVDLVVPELRHRGRRPDDYVGTTLRDHLGLPEQLGLDLRLTTHSSQEGQS
ncbi:NtaA/DmoA family FMN-dependent monooxygenase [Microbacterium sp. NPDC079995]|uniref:NtaA/DmoA family FMN-dependent monooxygenase n=1 Tax=unclassified Microbacterium TaxID=2609290 RepID=UPI00344D95DD